MANRQLLDRRLELVGVSKVQSVRCYICDGLPAHEFKYVAPPDGETKFIHRERWYPRSYSYCSRCMHWTSSLINRHYLDYETEYASSTYGSEIRKQFEKITSLPETKSDNQLRVKWLEQKVSGVQKCSTPMRVLDVGSGLGVFPHLLTKRGWQVTALEPNRDLCRHLHSLGSFRVWEGELSSLATTETFELITLNKVLEHVPDPTAMLCQIQKLMSPQGLLYVEVPDGEGASAESYYREEFFIEHLHVFSRRSLEKVSEAASYLAVDCTSVVEPSGKFTIRQLSRRLDE